jgi:integrase
LGLAPEVVAILQAHASSLRGRRAESDLLFPSKRGGFMSRSALDKPFAVVSKAIGLAFTDADGNPRGLSPRGMRRTFQDLARLSGVEKQVRQAVCGHATEEMSELYSTVGVAEMRTAVGLVARSILAVA